MSSPEFVDATLAVVARIPAGRVMTYGDVALAIGSNAPRAVGQVMALFGHAVPWWRVVPASGLPPQGHATLALPRYREEGTPLRHADSPDYRIALSAARLPYTHEIYAKGGAMSDVPPSPTPLRLAFARGMAPSRWAERWAQVSGVPLELVPVNIAYGRNDRVESDVTLERVLPSELPAGNAEPGRTRHAIQLYTEKLSLVIARDHEFAEQDTVSFADLATVTLLDHAQHPAEWPAPQPWADPSWMPTTLRAALQLVATGSGGIILPTMLARHLSDKREHALLTITDADALPSTTVWATWDVTRDAADVQELVGVLRGRTARSSRANTDVEAAPKPAKRVTKQPTKSAKSGPKPGSRGAQLAATRKKPPHRGRR